MSTRVTNTTKSTSDVSDTYVPTGTRSDRVTSVALPIIFDNLDVSSIEKRLRVLRRTEKFYMEYLPTDVSVSDAVEKITNDKLKLRSKR